ncbi:glycoside hydrolase family 28 protein [Mycena latifolia]|nr:glycoside hydrolase family 28 protein [Mycena latifolia]
MLSRFCVFALGILHVRATATAVNLAKRATCTPASAGDPATDDVPAIAAAFKTCGNGGIIVIPAGTEYAIRSPLAFTGCVSCDFQIEGTLKVSDDVDFWKDRPSVIAISSITGAQMRSVTGTGVIDGTGAPYWAAFNADSSYGRPTLVLITRSSGITISNLRFTNPPKFFHSVTSVSTNVVYDSLRLDSTSTSTAVATNTDGFDVGTTTFVTIRNTTVVNQDDCVAIKPGANFTTVTGITCTGSHGLSIGSLGNSAGSTDSVTNVFFGPATMINSNKAAGIKLHEGGSAHGIATVSNVTWSDITVQNCDYAIQILSCYEATNTTSCIPNTDTITGVTFENFSGTTSTKFSPVVANLHCSVSGTCDVVLKNFTVDPPSGTAQVQCSNIDGALGVTCSGAGSG